MQLRLTPIAVLCTGLQAFSAFAGSIGPTTPTPYAPVPGSGYRPLPPSSLPTPVTPMPAPNPAVSPGVQWPNRPYAPIYPTTPTTYPQAATYPANYNNFRWTPAAPTATTPAQLPAPTPASTGPKISNGAAMALVCGGAALAALTIATVVSKGKVTPKKIIEALKPTPPAPPPPPTPAQIEAAKLFGKKNLDPASAEIKELEDKIFGLKTHKDLPVIDFKQLTDFKAFTPGIEEQDFEYSSVFKAKLNGRMVVVKRMPLGHFDRHPTQGLINYDPDRLSKNHFNELKNSLLLNKVGLCPEFLGLTTLKAKPLQKASISTGDNELAAVFEYVPSETLRTNRRGFEKRLPHLPITEQTLKDIEKSAETLEKLGYTAATDLQYLITPKGRAVLMDTEFFHHPRLERDPGDIRDETPDNTPKARAKEMIKDIKSTLKKQKIHINASPD